MRPDVENYTPEEDEPRFQGSLAEMVSRDIMACGDEPGSLCQRIEFMGGEYPDNEKSQGGLCELSLTNLIAKSIIGHLSTLDIIYDQGDDEKMATRIKELESALTERNSRVTELQNMLAKKLDLIRCGIGSNYSGDPKENERYTEVVDLLDN